MVKDSGKIIFLFIDGFGIGEEDRSLNPFLEVDSDYFPQNLKRGEVVQLPSSGYLKAVDACLGTPGIPQSATGQASLFTGINFPGLLGRHLSAFRDKRIRKIIMKNNLLKSFKSMGGKSVFFNAYPGYNSFLNSGKLSIDTDGNIVSADDLRIKKRISVTTAMALSINQTFTGVEELREKKALYQDFTNEKLIGKFPGINKISPFEAGHILSESVNSYDLILYEYFITDQTAHRNSLKESAVEIGKIKELLDGVLNRVDLDETTVILTSDHGNIEDTSRGVHTLNPVPFAVWGRNGLMLTEMADSLTDITPAIMDVFPKKK